MHRQNHKSLKESIKKVITLLFEVGPAGKEVPPHHLHTYSQLWSFKCRSLYPPRLLEWLIPYSLGCQRGGGAYPHIRPQQLLSCFLCLSQGLMSLSCHNWLQQLLSAEREVQAGVSASKNKSGGITAATLHIFPHDSPPVRCISISCMVHNNLKMPWTSSKVVFLFLFPFFSWVHSRGLSD